MATPSPIFSITFARRAANSSGGKISVPLKTGWAAGSAASASTAASDMSRCLMPRMIALTDNAQVRRLARAVGAPAQLHDFEVVGRQRLERGIEHPVVPAPVHRPRDVHVGAVVGDDQPVALHCA